MWAISGFRNAAQDRDSRLSEDVLDHGFRQTRGVVIELQAIGLFIEAEFLESVRVRELAERAELLRLEPALELVGHGHECHGAIIASAAPSKIHSCTRRRRSALLTTETELKLMAAAAMIGLSNKPKKG